MRCKLTEQEKDQLPSTSTFAWWPVLFVAIAWICHTPTEMQNPERHAILTVFGWEVL